jgi:hypothetical protein
MNHQLHLFSPIKKAITKERIEQAKKLIAKSDTRSQLQGLRDLNDMLEIVERRITNKRCTPKP